MKPISVKNDNFIAAIHTKRWERKTIQSHLSTRKRKCGARTAEWPARVSNAVPKHRLWRGGSFALNAGQILVSGINGQVPDYLNIVNINTRATVSLISHLFSLLQRLKSSNWLVESIVEERHPLLTCSLSSPISRTYFCSCASHLFSPAPLLPRRLLA